MELPDFEEWQAQDEGDPVGRSTAVFPVVAIGASAGGIESLEQLLRRLQPCGLTVLVMQHLSPRLPSELPSLLARVTSLRVREATDATKLEQDVVYVAPPGTEVRVGEGVIRLRKLTEGRLQHPIDTLFRSLALDQGPNAIAVVLSGAGSDGSLGVRAIKEEGGITFVEEPGGAGQSGMPQSAIESGCVDFTLHPAAIADELMRLLSRPHFGGRLLVRRFGSDVLTRILERLDQAYGVDFTDYKLSTVERRIGRRMLLQHVERPSEYLKLLEAHRGEQNALYEDLLIGVTGFFRDREPFDFLSQTILPALMDKRPPERPVRVWVPGCATGEEAYSIAMCLLEYVEDEQPGQRLQIFATDVNEQALNRARHGVYPASIELDVSPERLQRFFSRADRSSYQVSRKVRDTVVFARHNLGKDPPVSRLDLISCRNLLIYLQPTLQKRVMGVFHYALNPQGCLLLGTAESVGESSDLFSLVDRKLKLYVKKHGAAPGVFDFSLGQAPERGPVAMTQPPTERKSEASLQQLVDRKILDKYGPPGVVMDEALNILQFRGQCAPYLAPSPGAATLNMLRMVRPELLVPLKSMVQRVLMSGLPVSCEPVRLSNAASTNVVMDMLALEASQRVLLVLFREVTELAVGEAAGPDGRELPESGAPKRIEELERELLTTKEYLETIIQELATSNEELQSLNEELQSSNEELQSTNEELETSKEELQATNEELVTVNEELQARIGQLGVASDDVVNLLVNVSSPVLLVGLDLRIRRFSGAAERLLNLIASDVGRPISYLGTALNVPQIEATVRDAINSTRLRELRVRCSNGGWYTLRTTPYQTADHSVRGGVIELVPFPAPSEPQDALELHRLTGQVLATLPFHLALVDQSLRIIWANEFFVDTWNEGAEVSGLSFDALLGSRESAPELWQRIDSSLVSGHPFGELVVTQPWGQRGERALRWTARSVPSEPQRPNLTLFTIQELSTD